MNYVLAKLYKEIDLWLQEGGKNAEQLLYTMLKAVSVNIC